MVHRTLFLVSLARNEELLDNDNYSIPVSVASKDETTTTVVSQPFSRMDLVRMITKIIMAVI